MKYTLFLNLFASLAAGAPVAERQQAGVDASALGRMWTKKIEDFINADKNVGLGVKTALTNNLAKCTLNPIQNLVLGVAVTYNVVCPAIVDGNGDGATQDATAMGQAWIELAGKTVSEHESHQTRQRIIDSVSSCNIYRQSGILIGDPDEFATYCPPLSGDAGPLTDETTKTEPATRTIKTNAATTCVPATSLPEKKEEKLGGQDKKGPCTSHEDCEGDLKCFTGNLIGDPNQCISVDTPTWGDPVTPLPQKKEEKLGGQDKKGPCTSHEDCEGDLKCFTGDLMGDPNQCISVDTPTWGDPVTPLS